MLKYTGDHYLKATELLNNAKIYAIPLIETFEEKYPDFLEIRKSNLFPIWDYCITIATVGFAFTLLADSFSPKECDAMAFAIRDVLDDWEKDFFNHGNYNVLLNFIDVFNTTAKEGMGFDTAIGIWVFIQLQGSKKASEKLKEMAQKPKNAQIVGAHIVASFINFWKNPKK